MKLNFNVLSIFFYKLFHFWLCTMFAFQRWHLQKEEKERKLQFKPNCCKYHTANILTRKRTQIKRLKIFHTNSLMFYTGKKKTYTKVIILEKKFHAVTKNLLMYILRTLKKIADYSSRNIVLMQRALNPKIWARRSARKLQCQEVREGGLLRSTNMVPTTTKKMKYAK